MKIAFLNKSLLSLGVLIIGAAAAQALPTVDWEDGTWTSGVTTQTGYVSGATSGSSTLEGGVEVDVSWGSTGTTTARPLNLTVNTLLQPGGDGAIFLAQVDDANGTSMQNFSTLTLEFNMTVSLASSFKLLDVDAGNFVDFVIVQAYLGGVLQNTVSYSPTAPYNTVATQYTPSHTGALGTATAAEPTTQGDVGISISGSFDEIRFTFTQGVGGAGNAPHGIGISDIALNAVPEPGTAATLAFAGVALLLFRNRRNTRHA
jgi:hypothetical protein